MKSISTKKIEAIKYNPKSKISYDEHKFKSITVKRNGDVISTKCKSTWMTLSFKGLIYLSYDKGRVYFFLDKINDKNKICDSTITDMGYNKETKTFTFRYKGLFETDNSEKEVDFIYEVLFDLKNDFDSFVKTIDCFINK